MSAAPEGQPPSPRASESMVRSAIVRPVAASSTERVDWTSAPLPGLLSVTRSTRGLTFDLDAELKIWISGTAAPIQKQFNKKLSIYEVQSVLASYVLR